MTASARFTGAVAMTLGGCGGLLHEVDEAPPAPVAAPASWSRTATVVEGPEGGRWWSTFDDPRLEVLIERALARNLDLVASYARLEQAKALRKSARSGFFPQIEGRASGSRARRNFNFGSGTSAIQQDTFTLDASASYELDVWGRVAHAAKGATRDFEASSREAQTAAMTVAAQVASTYYELVEQRAALELLSRQLESSETYLELLELRFDQGSASGLDVFQQREQVASRRSAVPPVEARIDVLENALSILLAEPPQTVEVESVRLPEVPPLPPVGIPAQVLRQRPDVRAAELRLVARDHRLGSAIADRYPRVNLTGSVGFNAFDFADLFQQFVWNLGANLTGAVFDGGRRAAEVDRNRALLEEQVATYASTILGALEEVENALANERRQVELIDALERQLEASRSTLSEARLRYANGLSDYLPVLTALTSVQQLEQSMLAARRQQLTFRIQLHRALGGTWAEGLDRPALSAADAPREGESS